VAGRIIQQVKIKTMRKKMIMWRKIMMRRKMMVWLV
jgi:hypothetical protein